MKIFIVVIALLSLVPSMCFSSIDPQEIVQVGSSAFYPVGDNTYCKIYLERWWKTNMLVFVVRNQEGEFVAWSYIFDLTFGIMTEEWIDGWSRVECLGPVFIPEYPIANEVGG